MQAVVYRRYGGPEVLRCEAIERPAAADDEVLIRVRAAALNPLDWHFMRGRPFAIRMTSGLRAPGRARPGVDVAGVVEAVGAKVTWFAPGDAVLGTCRGSLAEFACAAERGLVRVPENVSFEAAAAVPVAGVTALQGLRDRARIRAGHRVLINGAAGGVGTFAVQIAKTFGAAVSGVCSARNLEFVRSIGADRAIDYAREDFTTGPEPYDVILDCVGNRSLSECRRALTPAGTCVIVGGPSNGWRLLARAAGALVLSRASSRRCVMFIAAQKMENLETLRELLAAGQVKPVVDRRVGLAAVPEAMRDLETGHARGKIVVVLQAGSGRGRA